MQHLQAIEARIASIRSMVTSAMPAAPRSAEAFRSALDAAIGTEGSDVAGPGSGLSAQASFQSMAGRASLAARMGGLPQIGEVGAPVAPVVGRLSSKFGPRIHPISGAQQHHAGIDIAAPAGTPIRAAAGGIVEFAGTRGGYGNLVIVRHPDGVESYYAHQRDLMVRAGQSVGAGEVLGTVGSTGTSTGPHLHLEVRRDGRPEDPLPWLGMSGSPVRG